MKQTLALFDGLLPAAQARLEMLRRETEALTSIAKANNVEPEGDLLAAYAAQWQELDTVVADAEREADVVRAFMEIPSESPPPEVIEAWQALVDAVEDLTDLSAAK